jgi:hypothetical protein
MPLCHYIQFKFSLVRAARPCCCRAEPDRGRHRDPSTVRRPGTSRCRKSGPSAVDLAGANHPVRRARPPRWFDPARPGGGFECTTAIQSIPLDGMWSAIAAVGPSTIERPVWAVQLTKDGQFARTAVRLEGLGGVSSGAPRWPKRIEASSFSRLGAGEAVFTARVIRLK